MTLPTETQEQLGSALYRALRTRKAVPPITKTHPEITIEDAYKVSRHMLSQRLKKDNEYIVGKKIGVTSDVVQRMLGVSQPDFGFLTNSMTYEEGIDIPISQTMIAPRVEAEIAFRLSQTLAISDITAADVLEATECIFPCFEIVDSRIKDWQVRIEDSIADNASCGAYVLGANKIDHTNLDLSALHMALTKNGRPLSAGYSSSVLGNPLNAIAWLANTLRKFDIALEAGEIILSGSLVPLEPVIAGDEMVLMLTGQGFEPVSLSCRFI